MLAIASNGASAQLAVVRHADLHAVRQPGLGHPAAGELAWGSDSVMPVTETPCAAAAWIAKLPQPQPTSSTRWPGCSSSLVQTSSSLASCASSSVWAPREKTAQL